MNRKFNSGLIVLAVTVAVSIAAAALELTAGRMQPEESHIREFRQENRAPGAGRTKAAARKRGGKSYIAEVHVEGTIQEKGDRYNQQWILSLTEKLRDDPKNVAMALYINSPGGGVYQADELYLALQDYKTAGKKIYAYMGPMAASGGYYIACAADMIYANRNTLTGSIGVISGQSLDMTGFLEKLGIKSETIHSGKNKNMMNWNEPFTDEQKEIMQEISDECYEQFVSIVVARRGLSFSRVRELADGRIYTAAQALENGLIDSIDSKDNMMRDLAENELDLPGCRTKVFTYERKQTLVDSLVTGTAGALRQKIESATGIPLNLLTSGENGVRYPAYLLME